MIDCIAGSPLRERLEIIEEIRERVIGVELDTLSDMLSSVIEGGTILFRVLNDKYVLVNQLKQYRNYLRLLSGDNRN